jgi:hypothetical protein
LPEKCSTIEEAYEMLKPDEVKRAEDIGETIYRQGEFFFIPAYSIDGETFIPQGGEEITQIRIGNSRPNTVSEGYAINGKFYVTGKISHTGREHADLFLDIFKWYKVVPNTSKANFQLTGDID